VPKKRVIKKSWNPNWDIVTYVDDTDQNANANDSTGSRNAVSVTPPSAETAHVKPVDGQSDMPPTFSTGGNADVAINLDTPFEHGEIRLAQFLMTA